MCECECVFVCMCLCVCVREREREKETGGKRDSRVEMGKVWGGTPKGVDRGERNQNQHLFIGISQRRKSRFSRTRKTCATKRSIVDSGKRNNELFSVRRDYKLFSLNC